MKAELADAEHRPVPGKRKERECVSDDNGADEAAEDDHDEADDPVGEEVGLHDVLQGHTGHGQARGRWRR